MCMCDVLEDKCLHITVELNNEDCNVNIGMLLHLVAPVGSNKSWKGRGDQNGIQLAAIYNHTARCR